MTHYNLDDDLDDDVDDDEDFEEDEEEDEEEEENGDDDVETWQVSHDLEDFSSKTYSLLDFRL
jgi:hypothetical protein